MKGRVTIFLGLLLLTMGIYMISNNYIEEKVEKSYNNMNLKILAFNDSQEASKIIEEGIDDGYDEGTITEEIQEEPKKEAKINYDYVGKITIPKISLERGFVSKNSKYNSINYGIETHKISTYPNVSGGNLILLSHSGTSYRSFFRNLYKLELGDDCYIEYQGVKYHFVITKIYNQPKTGKVVIDRNYKKTTLTLITCTHNSKTEQTIYILELA